MAIYQSMYKGAQMDAADTEVFTPDATPTEGSTNLVTSGGVFEAIEAAETNAENGEKPLLIAGNAEQLVSSQYTEDTTPYLFRQSGGGVTVGKREIDKLVGATMAWNELVQNGDFANGTTNWSKNSSASWSVLSNVLTFTAASGTSNNRIYQGISTATGHKLFFAFSIKSSALTSAAAQLSSGNGISISDNLTIGSAWTRFSIVVSANGDTLNAKIGTRTILDSAAPLDITNVIVCDLTQMFGSTIADYVYTLESGNAGDGVAWLKAHGFFTENYYSYDAGSLQSVNASSHITTGKNLFNKNAFDVVTGVRIDLATGNTYVSANASVSGYINVIGNIQYVISGAGAGANRNAAWYDSAKNVISTAEAALGSPITAPANAAYIRFDYTTTYANAAQLQIGSSATAYEPYHANTYPLDASLTLRGLYKLDASNNLYADGDEYTSDGTVTRNYGTRAYQAGDESDATVITDGATTVYPITATTETAEPFASPQDVTAGGTEQYTDAGVEAATRDVAVPVGHDTKYTRDLVAVIENIPDAPAADGTYTLTCTVSGGVATYSWEA